jgi:dTDP-4-dehydrorhamnose 3,5-epimerase
MNNIRTEIESVIIVEPSVFEDHRGYFFESFSERWFREQVADVHFVQDNESKSSYGVLRGLHYQTGAYAQAKLVRVIQGKALDVAVDLRRSSPTFGKYVAVELSAENRRQLFVPRGFAHGFVVLSTEVVFQYKCDNYYAPGKEGSLRYNDPTVGIDWKITADPILSEKDKNAPLLKDAVLFD